MVAITLIEMTSGYNLLYKMVRSLKIKAINMAI